MWVDACLKVPDEGDWLAITRVTSDGVTTSCGYLAPETLVEVAETIRPLLARVPEEGHSSGDTVLAWESFMNWVDVVKWRI